MPAYYVIPYFLKADKVHSYTEWLSSDKAKKLEKDFEKETGIKYIGTFFPVLGFGESDAEDWFEMKKYADLDKLRDSKVFGKWYQEIYEYLDETRQVPSRLYRSASDVKVFEPPKKK